MEDYKKSLLIVDDHDMFREMLVHLLSLRDEYNIVGTVGSIAEADEAFARENPSVVLLDILLPDGSGIEWARILKQTNPQTKILFVSAFDSDETVVDAFQMGVEGFVAKNSSSERLLDALKAVSSEEYIYYPASILTAVHNTGKMQSREPSVASQHNTYGLSNREMQIALLVSQGLTYQEIADSTGVSINTVKTHVQRIYKRVGVSSRRELSKRFLN